MTRSPFYVPPTGDPQRPLHLAVRSTRLLGIAATVIGLFVVVAFGYFNRFERFRPYFIALGLAVGVVPGVVFFLCSVYIARRSRAAVYGALATAALHLLFAAAFFVASVTLEPVSPIPVLVSVLWVLALLQLLWHLWRSLGSIRLDTEYHRGFDMTLPRPALPVGDTPPGAATGNVAAPPDAPDVLTPK